MYLIVIGSVMVIDSVFNRGVNKLINNSINSSISFKCNLNDTYPTLNYSFNDISFIKIYLSDGRIINVNKELIVEEWDREIPLKLWTC